MRFPASDYYTRGSSSDIRVGAVFREVPVPWFAGTKLVTIQALADGRIVHGNFSAAWQRSTAETRAGGLPLLQRAKLRPAILLRVGIAMEDATQENDLWVAPLYREKERSRSGPILVRPWNAE